MLKIRLLTVILIALFIAGCAINKQANRYTPSLNDSGKYLFGRWIEVKYTAAVDSSFIHTLAGELIAYSGHDLYVLDSAKMNIMPDSLITTARLFLYRKNPNKFLITSLLMIIPNAIGMVVYPEYALGFLALAIVPVINGAIFTLVDRNTPTNELRYPKKELKELAKFARFPQGLPAGVDPEELRLPPPVMN
ncbi:MAG: hypothetical protein RBS55_00975 [Bacteroidales bacterium]|jgi:hypothetical protein|nr:hypothetical protein [Bacteroidales bacterium]